MDSEWQKKLWFWVVLTSSGLVLVISLFVFKNIWTRGIVVDRHSLSSDSVVPPPVFVSRYQPETLSLVSEEKVAAKYDPLRKLIQASSPEQVAAVQQAAQHVGGTVLEINDSAVIVQLPSQDTSALNQALATQPDPVVIEDDHPIFMTVEDIGWGTERITAPLVWPLTMASGVKVGIIDTGIEYTHPDLQVSYAGGYDFVNDDADPRDDQGHGTHVAGIVAATRNDQGTIGVAPQASVVALKVLDENGVGYLSDLIMAVDWARQNRVPVINISLAAQTGSSILQDSLNKYVAAGGLAIAAAGNTNGGPLQYPAAYSSVISVGAADAANQLAGFSSVGAELVAPGVDIVAPTLSGQYKSLSGTSMAAPHVAGIVALMIARGQTNVRETLRQTATDTGPVGSDGYFGYGLVQAEPAVLGTDTLAPHITFIKPEHASQVAGDVLVEATITDESALQKAELLVDNVPFSTWTAAPYTAIVPKTTLNPGEHTLVIQATDLKGNIGMTQVQIMVPTLATPTPTSTATPLLQSSPLSSASASSTDSAKQKVMSPSPTVSSSPSASVSIPGIGIPRSDQAQRVLEEKFAENTSFQNRGPIPVGTNQGARQRYIDNTQGLPSSTSPSTEQKEDSDQRNLPNSGFGVFKQTIREELGRFSRRSDTASHSGQVKGITTDRTRNWWR
jgi:subtilisin/minor extracellular protease Epr